MALNRRAFLKGTAGVGAGVALGGCASTAKSTAGLFSPIKKVPTASHFGAFYAHVQDGKIVDVSPQISDEHETAFTKAWIARNNAQDRILYPYVRKSYLEGKRGNKELRGNDEFVRVSWDKVAKLVAKKIKKTPKKNIYNAIYSGWSHPALLNSVPTLGGKFFNTVKGGAVGTSGEYSNGAAGPTNPGIMGDMEVYSLQTAHPQILENTQVYVMWGADLFKTNKVDYAVANHKNDIWYKKYKEAVDAGKIRFISIDPQVTETAKMLGAKTINIRPNTDVALMLGMMYHLYTTKKYDKAFIDKYTHGFDKFLPYLLGKTDRTPKTPQWAEKITTVPAKTIKSLAELFVSKRTFIAGNWAMQRADHGEQADWGLFTLASMIGQIGLPGGGIGMSMHYAGGGQAKAGKAGPGGFSQGRNKVKDVIPASRISETLLNPGKKISFKGKDITLPHIKLMYIGGCNIVGHHPDINELIKALKTLDTFIVQEPWWTPTAKLADIVLPASTILERNDISAGGSYSGDFIYAMHKVVDAPGEAKGDYEIFCRLAKEFGDRKYKRFTGGKSEMEHLKDFYSSSDAAKSVSFEEFWKKGYVQYEIPSEAYKYVRHADFRADPVKNPLKTQSGKIQIFSEKYASYGYDDFKGHVMWFEPYEWLGDKKARKHPLHLLSPHPTYRLHSQLDNTWLKDMYKINGREPIVINPKDARKYGLKQGDVAEVYNERGRLLAGVKISKDVMEGVAILQEGVWYSPEDPSKVNSRGNSGQPNVLTSSKPTSHFAQATTANTCLVSIKKAGGAIKPNQAYNPPKIRQV